MLVTLQTWWVRDTGRQRNAVLIMVSKRWPSLSENQPYHLSSGNHWTALLFFSCLPFDNMHFSYSGICVEESTLSPILCSCEAFISFGAVYFSLPFLFCAMWIAIRSAPCDCLCWPFFLNSSVRFVSGSSLCFDSFSKQDKLITQGVLSKQRLDWLHNAFVMVTDS